MIMQRRAWVAVAMSASFILMAWRVLMVLPKVTRSRARASDISSMRWHMPRFESAMCTREMASECMATSMPCPSRPSKYFGSSFTLVILKPACPAPRQPIMCGMSREMASECMATSMPCPSRPSKYFGSSFTLVILKPACPAPRQPIMCGMSTSSKPSASMGTKNALKRSSPSLSGSVTAMT